MKTETPARKKKLVSPSLQLRLVGTFLGIAVLSLLSQFLVLAAFLYELAPRIPSSARFLQDEIPSLLMTILLVSFGVLCPLVFAIGVLATFRVAGPVFRFERYLEAVIRGGGRGALSGSRQGRAAAALPADQRCAGCDPYPGAPRCPAAA